MNTIRLKAVLLGGLVAGTLDIAFALSFAAYNGTAPMRLLQAVASGMFGKAAFAGGAPMAAGGLALHFGLSFLWAGLFLMLALALARFRPSLTLRPFLSGSLFGVLVFLGMRLVVLPLSAFPFPISFKPVATVSDLLSHMLLFGVPIALAARGAAAGARTDRAETA
jgi:uncharacterized membrane protein YagU involved in acid resistance